MSATISRTLVAAAVTAVSALAGCASPTPNLDAHYGEAVLQAKAQQTINPDASKNMDPVAGIDGRAARSAMTNYQKSFTAPPPTFNVINIGGGISAGGGGGSSGGN